MRRNLRGFLFSFILLGYLLGGCVPAVTPYPRAGMGVSEKTDAGSWARQLGAGWYLDWHHAARPVQAKPEYWQTIRVGENASLEDLQSILDIAKKYPGQTWIIGNEPDNEAQDRVTAEEYAVIYHDWYTQIKAVDPGAKIAIGGVSQPSDLRMKYLDLVLTSYQARFGSPLPVDWWTVHGYVLREERGSWGAGIPLGLPEDHGLLIEVGQHSSLDLFKNQIAAFRVWMKLRGYQDKPLAITEFGILLPRRLGYPAETIAQYLLDTSAWLDSAVDPATGDPADGYRLVQRWAWFSLSDNSFPDPDLADLKNKRLTLVGEAFRKFVKERTQQP